MRATWELGLRSTFLLAIALSTLQSGFAEPGAEKPATLEPIRIVDGQFVLGESGKRFSPWGFNFVGDFGRIVEEYWEEDWPRVEKDFREMRKLGANVVRLHLQLGTYMNSPQEVNAAELERLRRNAKSCPRSWIVSRSDGTKLLPPCGSATLVR